MSRVSLLRLVAIFFALSCPVYAAQSIDNLGRRGTVDDLGGMGTVNHNYYAAQHDPWLQMLLGNVEANHLYSTSFLPNGGGVVALIRQGKLGAAMADLNYLLERFVNHPMGLNLLGVVGRRMNDRHLPIEFYEKAIRLYPGYAFTHAQYGGYLVDIGYPAAGIIQLQKALDLDPHLAPAYAGLARAYSKSGKPELAHEATKKAKELGYRDRPLEQGVGDRPQSEE